MKEKISRSSVVVDFSSSRTKHENAVFFLLLVCCLYDKLMSGSMKNYGKVIFIFLFVALFDPKDKN